MRPWYGFSVRMLGGCAHSLCMTSYVSYIPNTINHNETIRVSYILILVCRSVAVAPPESPICIVEIYRTQAES